MPVVARAWCRVDLAGGTLDIWPLGLLHPGACTVNVTIDLPVTVRLVPRSSGYRIRPMAPVGEEGSDGDAGGEALAAPSSVEADSLAELVRLEAVRLPALIAQHLDLPPVEIELSSGSPRGGGLGASSAMAIALLAAGDAFAGPADAAPRPPEELARTARDLEARLMGLPTGVQDHYPSLHGGALKLSYEPGAVTVETLDIDLEALGRHWVVAYSGQSHVSAEANWGVVRRRLDGDPEIRGLFDGIQGVAGAMAAALEAEDWRRVGSLLGEEWALRRQLAPGVSTPRVEALLEVGRAAGAWGGKACGAGGGGSLVLLAPEERRDQVARALAAEGAEILPARPTPRHLELVASG